MKTDDEGTTDKGLEPGEVDIVRQIFRRLALANAESIGRELVKKAGEGNYNAAHLLLELGGIDLPINGKTDAEVKNPAPRIFLLDLVDKMLSRNQAGERNDTTGNQT